MNKRIASFIPNFWSPHFETDLELIKRHVDDGDHVTAYVCNGDLPSCYGNLLHSLDTCKSCVNRRRNGFELLNLNEKVCIQNFLNIGPRDLDLISRFRDVKLESKEQLWSLQIDDYFPGRAAYNEIACHLREIEPVIEENAEYFARALESAVTVYLSFKNTFSQQPIDCFYTFNGRLLVSNAAIAAAKACNVPFAVHEQGFVNGRFFVVFNESIHSLANWNRRLTQHWEQSEDPISRREEIAADWFERRIVGKKQGWYSFTADQRDELPDSFDPNNINVVIFNSSEFETVGMEDYQLKLYQSQNEAVERIARDLLVDPAVKVYLRVHPNLKGRDNPQVHYIQNQLTGTMPNLEVIAADSPIGSYKLMASADLVLTFGSTIGIEAAYMGMPSVLLGPAVYESLDACYKPCAHEELIDLIRGRTFRLTEPQRAERRANAVKYAYFMSTVGSPFKHFNQKDIADIRERHTDATISYSSVPYANGLRKELESRAELRSDAPLNPLASTVRELMFVADELTKENKRLQQELDVAQATLNTVTARIASSVHHIGGSMKRRLKRLIRSNEK